MEIIIDTIYFKSNTLFFEKEQMGIKPNTVRFINEKEKDFLINKIWKIKFIVIESIENKKISFTRNITDISFNNNHMIISWKHNANI